MQIEYSEKQALFIDKCLQGANVFSRVKSPEGLKLKI